VGLLLVVTLLGIGLLLPVRVVLIAVPMLLVAANARLVGPIAEFGPVALMAQDPLLLAAVVKLIATILTRPSEPLGRATLALALFFLALVPGLIAGWRTFGISYTTDRAVSLARLGLEALAIPALATSVRTPAHARLVERGLYAVAFVAAGSIYFDRLFMAAGLAIGEVINAGSGFVRTFGVVGDQVGLFLAFFFLHSVVRRRLAPSLFFLGGIVLTLGVGAMLTVSVGIGVVALLSMRGELAAWAGARGTVRPGARLRTMLLVAGVMACAVGFGVWVVRERFASGAVFTESSGLQRLLTAAAAVDIVQRHPVAGIGYLGMLPASMQYGSIALIAAGWDGGDIPAVFVVNAGNQYLELMVDGGIIGAVAYVAMLVGFAGLLQRAARGATAQRPRELMLAGFIWLVALMVGCQSAVWLLPGSLIATSVFLLVGTAQGLRFAALGAERPAVAVVRVDEGRRGADA
jgi:O-antigen ligase